MNPLLILLLCYCCCTNTNTNNNSKCLVAFEVYFIAQRTMFKWPVCGNFYSVLLFFYFKYTIQIKTSRVAKLRKIPNYSNCVLLLAHNNKDPNNNNIEIQINISATNWSQPQAPAFIPNYLRIYFSDTEISFSERTRRRRRRSSRPPPFRSHHLSPMSGLFHRQFRSR